MPRRRVEIWVRFARRAARRMADPARGSAGRGRRPAEIRQGGDHSFKVPKSGALSQSDVYELAMDEIMKWIGALES